MKKKKIICVMLIFLILLIPSYQINAATNGWKINGQNKYYYINNKKITGSKKIGKYYYYFDKKGRMVKNKIVKIKVITIITNQTEKDVPRKISRNKSVQNTIISIPKVKLTFIKAL